MLSKTSRSQPYLTFRPLFSWKIPEKLFLRLDLLYVAPASLLPSSAHQLLLRLSQGAVFAAEDDVHVDGVDDNDDCDVYVDGKTLLQEIGCTCLKSFSSSS